MWIRLPRAPNNCEFLVGLGLHQLLCSRQIPYDMTWFQIRRLSEKSASQFPNKTLRTKTASGLSRVRIRQWGSVWAWRLPVSMTTTTKPLLRQLWLMGPLKFVMPSWWCYPAVGRHATYGALTTSPGLRAEGLLIHPTSCSHVTFTPASALKRKWCQLNKKFRNWLHRKLS